MKAEFAHLSFEFKSVWRDKSLLLMNYLFPLVFYLMMAIIMPGIYPAFHQTMIPGMVVFTIMVSTLLGMPGPIVHFREKGVYRSYKIYGVPLKSVLFIPVFTTAIHIILVSIFILFSGAVFFKARIPQNFYQFIWVYGIILFNFTGLGLLVGVCSPSGKISILLAQLIFLPSMMLGGIIMPSGMLPGTILKIAGILQTTYAMDLLKSLAYGEKAVFGISKPITALVLGGLLSYILAAWLFAWDMNDGKKVKNLLGFLVLLPFIICILVP